MFAGACVYSEECAKSCVRYVLSGGRFGDNLLAVAHAKWVSYTLGLPLMYNPFPFSDQLQLSKDPSLIHSDCQCISPYFDDLQRSIDPFIEKKGCYHLFSQYILRSRQQYLNLCRLMLSANARETALVTVPYYPESRHDFRRDADFYTAHIEVDWNDPCFKEELRRLFSPLHPTEKHEFPEGRTTVALHIRSGAGFDQFNVQKVLPLKSPPLSYYVDALNILREISSQPLYVFIFTDDPFPERFKSFFSSNFSDTDISFACRMKNNRHDRNVLDDFFAFSQFDCLICTYSHYSYVASKVFDFDMIVTPVDFTKDEFDNIAIEPIELQVNTLQTKRPLKMLFRKNDQEA